MDWSKHGYEHLKPPLLNLSRTRPAGKCLHLLGPEPRNILYSHHDRPAHQPLANTPAIHAERKQLRSRARPDRPKNGTLIMFFSSKRGNNYDIYYSRYNT